LPRELHESELFGHERGSFTGATSEKAGLFDQADGGTIFLDEIGDLARKAQGKLLRVLQDGELRRVGELKQRRVDVRVVAATNRDLKKSVRDGAFREDLYHRLNGLLVRIPSLRERPEDIEVLVAHYLEHYERRYRRRVNLPAELLDTYKRFSWPGNVRELQQELHRMVLLTADGSTMRIDDSQVFQLAGAEDSTAVAHSSGYDTAMGDEGRRLIVDALQQAAGNKAKAARILNMSRTTLLGKMRRLGIGDQ
jgi:transcriptional regulator with GAF, ATPase, and Fis domain